MTTPEMMPPTREYYHPAEILARYERLEEELEVEIRDLGSNFAGIMAAYAPGFNPDAFPEREAGSRNQLLAAAADIIGDRSGGDPRWQVLEKRQRPPLSAEQSAYVLDMATHIGLRFPRPAAEGGGFYPDNTHQHAPFAELFGSKEVIVEGGSSMQAKVRRELAERVTDDGFVETSCGRPIAALLTVKNPDGTPKLDDDGQPIKKFNKEYGVANGLIGPYMPTEEITDAGSGKALSYPADITEYGVFRGYNLTRGDYVVGDTTATASDGHELARYCEQLDVFVDNTGRYVTLMQPKTTEGKRATLIDGVRTYLTYLQDSGNLQVSMQLAIITNGQYCALNELTVARLLAEKFPEVTGLHVIGDETGKRGASVYLDEVGRLMRNLVRK
jgi:hypothetical protein